MHTTSHGLHNQEMLTGTFSGFVPRRLIESLGIHISRYGLVVTLLLIGVLKFTAGEAQGIQPLVANSPDVLAVSNLQRSGRFQSDRRD